MAFNKIYTVIGARGTGKTPLIMGGDEEQGLAKIFLKKGMSVLILDTLDHPKYRMVPILQPGEYSKLTTHPGIYRTLASIGNMPKLINRLKDVWNTLIVFEDCYKYFGDKFTDDQIAAIGDSKQQNNDLLFMHWCWGFASPDLFRMTNYYIIFKTGDSPEDRKTHIRGCYKQCIDAYNTVTAGKKRYVVIDSGI